MKLYKKISIYHILLLVFIVSATGTIGYMFSYFQQSTRAREVQNELQSMKEEQEMLLAVVSEPETAEPEISKPEILPQETLEQETLAQETLQPEIVEPVILPPEILPKYQALYEINSDMVGWLTIEDTNIDYPVMQTMADEDYYLSFDFYKEPNKNGCLILDTDSAVGTGTASLEYADGNAPSTNLIIHGHTKKSGDMFGKLKLYADEEYGKEHQVICFDSLYEERAYELIAVFYSQVFYENEDVFKYYAFFQADTREEFDNWYSNIKEMSLYDTGVTAEFGDEFITLSCCAYHTENGRFVVVGRRKKLNT
ncbi:MAG: class B sortase [Lachnospiraceae bacterium]|nr:class B sortase [Lachnospiraceae bacterium]